MFVRQPEKNSVTLPGIGGRGWPAHEHFAPGKFKQFVSLHLCLIFRKSQSARCDVIFFNAEGRLGGGNSSHCHG